MATHSSILTWRIPIDRGTWHAAVHGVTESDMTERLSSAHLLQILICAYREVYVYVYTHNYFKLLISFVVVAYLVSSNSL